MSEAIAILDLNMRCVKFMEWKTSQYNEHIYKPLHEHVVRLRASYGIVIENMHFHDSYDWAILMLEKYYKDDGDPLLNFKLFHNGKILSPWEICEQVLAA